MVTREALLGVFPLHQDILLGAGLLLPFPRLFKMIMMIDGLPNTNFIILAENNGKILHIFRTGGDNLIRHYHYSATTR